MKLYESLPVIDKILGQWSEAIGRDLGGYRNHVYRMVNFTLAVGEFDDEARRKIEIAICFRDIASGPNERSIIWSRPQTELKLISQKMAWKLAAVDQRDLPASQVKNFQERSAGRSVFARATSCRLLARDFQVRASLSFVSEVRSAFRIQGFHKCPAGIAANWIIRHPLNQVPVIRY